MKIKKILVSQPQPSSEKSPYFEIAQKHGVQIDFRPFIKVEGLSTKEFRLQRINIAEHTAVIFTSRTAIDHFFKLCEGLRVTISEDMRYFCISEAVALYLQKYILYRKRRVSFAASGKKEDLITPIYKHSGEKYIIPIADVNNDEFCLLLDKKNIQYTKAVMYRTVSNDFAEDEAFDHDMVVFFSPSGINSLLKNFPTFEQKDIKIGCLGVTTAQAIKDAGLRLDFEAPTPEAPSITAAIDNYLKAHQKK